MRYVLLLLCVITQSQAQDLDSLLVKARNAQTDSTKTNLFNQAAFGFIFKDSDKARSILEEALEGIDSISNSYGYAVLTNTKGIYMDVTGRADSAMYYFSKARRLSKTHGHAEVGVRAVNGLGMVHWNQGKFEKALDYFFEAFKGYEQLGNEKSQAIPLNNIGLIYQELLQYEKALEFHKRSYALRKKYKVERDQPTSLNNIGICFMRLNQEKEALEAFRTGLDISQKVGNTYEYFQILGNLGDLYRDQGKIDLAVQTFLHRLDMPTKLKNNQRGQLITLTDLVDLFNQKNQPQKAMFYAERANSILKDYPGYLNAVSDFPLFLAESHFRLGNYPAGREQLLLYNQLKDSVFSEETSKLVSEMEVRYETEKKDKEILVQRAELQEQQFLIQKRNLQLVGLMVLVFLLVCIGYLLYKHQRLKAEKMEKENEYRLAVEKINAKNRLQEERLRISRDLHDNIGAQLTFIISSLDNMKMTLSEEDAASNVRLNEISGFAKRTITELRDTVWAMNKGSISVWDLKNRITDFIEKVELGKLDVKFNTKIPKTTEEISFSSLMGINIFRIVQEALTNVIKHASANGVSVDFAQDNEMISVDIKDDGIGFDMAPQMNGNGILNMKKRALEIGGYLDVVTQKEGGTVIHLKIPLAS